MLTDGSAILDGIEHRWSTVGLYRIHRGLIAACWLLPLDQAAFDRAWSGSSSEPAGAAASRRRDPVLIPRAAARPPRRARIPRRLRGAEGAAGVCITRCAGRRSRAPADPKVVEQLWREFTDVSTYEPSVIDTAALGADDAAGVIAQRLDGDLLIRPA